MGNCKKDQDKKGNDSAANLRLGIFFILLGVALIVALNDMLNLGNVGAYFTWESVLIFLGLIMFINKSYLAGFLCIAGGGWFMLDDIYPIVPQTIKTLYWPAVLILLGLGLILAALVKKFRNGLDSGQTF